MFLNTSTDQYRCVLCGAHGNSVTLYARVKGLSNLEAFRELEEGGNIYPMPKQPASQYTEAAPRPLAERSKIYSDMLELLSLSDRHKENLIGRGLSEERIVQNQYRSMPETQAGRRLLASLLRSCDHELEGIPGFRTRYGEWTLAGPNGFLIPVRDKDGLIQGLKIRLDDEADPDRKYCWLSSRDMPHGTRSYSWVHVTGDRSSRRAYLTEGPLKGDVASFLDNDALFVCIGGVNALHGLKDTVRELGVTELVVAMDMDQNTNPHVRNAVLAIRRELGSLPNIRYSKYVWSPAYKGVDDYYHARAAA